MVYNLNVYSPIYQLHPRARRKKETQFFRWVLSALALLTSWTWEPLAVGPSCVSPLSPTLRCLQSLLPAQEWDDENGGGMVRCAGTVNWRTRIMVHGELSSQQTRALHLLMLGQDTQCEAAGYPSQPSDSLRRTSQYLRDYLSLVLASKKYFP